MVKKDQILDEVEKTLHAFDNDPLLEENPFLLTRIRAAREHRLRKRSSGVVLKVNLKYVIMVVIVLINVITVAHCYEWIGKHNLQEKLISDLKEDFPIDQSQNGF